MRLNLLSCIRKNRGIINRFIIHWFPLLSMNPATVFPFYSRFLPKNETKATNRPSVCTFFRTFDLVFIVMIRIIILFCLHNPLRQDRICCKPFFFFSGVPPKTSRNQHASASYSFIFPHIRTLPPISFQMANVRANIFSFLKSVLPLTRPPLSW